MAVVSDWETETNDGGAPPGGAPAQQACDCGPCAACAEEYSMTNPCAYQLGHGATHHCSYGHEWYQDGPYGTIQRTQCTSTDPGPGCNAQCVKDNVHNIPHWCGQHEW